MKLLSVCIPAYNYAHYLEECIDSCLGSDQENYEVVVLDNGSTDHTSELSHKYSAYPKVRWFRNPYTIPPQENWNRVVSLANGKFIKVLAADDFLLPNAITSIFKLIDLYPRVEFFGHNGIYVDKYSQPLRVLPSYFYSNDRNIFISTGNEAVRLKIQNKFRFKEPSFNFFTKDAWQRIGGYSSNYRFVYDIHFNLRLMSNHLSAVTNDCLAAVRRHNESDGKKLSASLAVDELIHLYQDIKHNIIANSWSVPDQRQVNANIQYRIIELLFQKHMNLLDASSYAPYLKHITSYPTLFRLLLNRILTSTVQVKMSERDFYNGIKS